MEVLRAQVSFWESRAFGLYWTKPLLPSLWYLSTGFYVDSRPEEMRWIDHTSISTRLSIGRRVAPHTRVFLGVIPYYEILNVHSRNADSTVSTRNVDFTELFTNLSTGTDFRNARYDARSGWAFYSTFSTNAVHHDIVTPYYQFTGDFRFYIPSVFKDHKVATRLQLQMRDKQTGIYHALAYGGEITSLRGYARSLFPLNISIRDAALVSTEYRFPIWRFEPMRIPLLSRFSRVFNAIEFRLDGAAIFDYGRMAPSLKDLTSLDGTIESGLGIGGGLRVMVPTLQKSAVIDVVWGEDPRTGRGSVEFLRKPAIYLYVDLHY